MSPRILVLGKNYSTPLGVIRSLAHTGYKVDLMYIANHKGNSKIVAASKYLETTIEIIGRDDQTIIDTLLTRFSRKSEQYLLFPTDDYTASLIDRYSSSLKDLFLMPHIINGSITKMMDKSNQGALAKKCGLSTAREWIISLDTESVIIPEDVVFPCFVKPLISALGGKSELAKCENREELKKKLYALQKRLKERSIIIQEFMHIQQEYTIGGVCNDQEIILPAIIKKYRVAQHNRGITLSGTLVENEAIGTELLTIVEFLKSVHYVGMFDLEVMLTDKGLYFGELNLRCGGPSYAYYKCGINLPALAVQAICGESIHQENISLNYNLTFVNNKVAWEDYAELYLTKSDLDKLYRECAFTLLSDDDDPDPEHIFNLLLVPEYKKNRWGKRIKNAVRPLYRLFKNKNFG